MRSSARLLPLLLSALPAFVLVGSGARATDSEPLLITITATPTSILPPDETTLLSITVENRSATRVEWERGSSSCQLASAALVSGTWLIVGSRVCAADAVSRGLDPGQRFARSPIAGMAKYFGISNMSCCLQEGIKSGEWPDSATPAIRRSP